MPRIEIELEPEGWVEADWPNCATPDCPNLICLGARTGLCYPCSVELLGKVALDSLLEAYKL